MSDRMHKHPDSPGQSTVNDELSNATGETMGELGRADLDELPDPADAEQQDESSPGQNSDWLPQ